MKKGFTIVELAIVLMVLGLIMGMSLKGVALVSTARMRADVARLNKIQAATAALVSQYEGDISGLQGASTGGIYDSNKFFETGFLLPLDLNGHTTAPDKWVFRNCAQGAVDTNAHLIETNYNHGNICIRHNKMSEIFACNVEKLMDDEDLTNGQNRGIYGITVLGNIDCDNATVVNAFNEAQMDFLVY